MATVLGARSRAARSRVEEDGRFPDSPLMLGGEQLGGELRRMVDSLVVLGCSVESNSVES